MHTWHAHIHNSSANDEDMRTYMTFSHLTHTAQISIYTHHLKWMHTLWMHTLCMHTLWMHTLCMHTLWMHTLWMHTLWMHTLWMHTLCMHTLWMHTLWMHTLWMHTLCMHTLCMHTLCMHTLCMHTLWMHTLCMHTLWKPHTPIILNRQTTTSTHSQVRAHTEHQRRWLGHAHIQNISANDALHQHSQHAHIHNISTNDLEMLCKPALAILAQHLISYAGCEKTHMVSCSETHKSLWHPTLVQNIKHWTSIKHWMSMWHFVGCDNICRITCC